MTKCFRTIGRLLIGAAFATPIAVFAASNPPAFSVSGLQGWSQHDFDHEPLTRYSIVTEDGERVVHAQCMNSASGLAWQGSVDLDKTPELLWRWKVNRIYTHINEQKESGDDFPARVYLVTGTRWLPWTLRVLCYVWSNGRSSAFDWSSPYTGREKIIPVRRGTTGEGRWQTIRRNVVQDFYKAFRVRVHSLSDVGIMTDCDNSHNHAQAWYSDLHFVVH